jgi:GMP synthase-like glutamine amidotransferase
MSILVFQHSAIVGPGRFAATFRDHGFRLDVRRLDLSAEHPFNVVGKSTPGWFPADLDDVQGILSLGGAQNVGESHPWMETEYEFLREAQRREMPVVGICLGSQLIAHALGGEVGKMERPEVGFQTVSLNAAGQTEALLSGIGWDVPQYQSHGYEVKKLPEGAVLLGSSRQCKVQVYRVGLRTLGMQYHPECDRMMLDALIASDKDWLAAAGISSQEIAAQCERHYGMYARMADRLCVNLATFAFPLFTRAAPARNEAEYQVES